MRRERRLRMFENGGLKKILWSNRDEVTGEWRLHNDEVYDLYSSKNIIRMIK